MVAIWRTSLYRIELDRDRDQLIDIEIQDAADGTGLNGHCKNLFKKPNKQKIERDEDYA